MDNTHYFKEGLEKIGYDVVVEPELNIVAFNHPDRKLMIWLINWKIWDGEFQ